MIRIQGGRLRGRPLVVPAELRTRPTSGRLRAALFSILGEELSGEWIDLFAGAGGLGIESLSRGADHCRFVELEPRALSALRANLEALELDPASYRIHRADARRWLRRWAERESEICSGMLCDPPYGGTDPELLLPLGRRLVESGRLRAFVLEHSPDASVPALSTGAEIRVETRRHGGGAFTLIEVRRS